LKPNQSESVLTLGVAEREIEMGIDLNSLPFIMQQLTDLYSDPILACVREYSTNANDSHSFAGTERPIEVTLPTADDLNFTVQDWGLGMSEDDIVAVYSKYGASTGRNTNDVTGMLGFGSKSAMTYGNSFRVESTKDGVTLLAVVTKSADDIPRIKIMSRIEAGRPNGVKITIPVRREDIGEWAERADGFFKFWRDPVLVNGEEPRKFYEIDSNYVQVEPDIWVHLAERDYYASTVSVFVQGGVPYPLEMKEHTNHKVGASDVFVCYVDTGLMDFTPSREALMHTDRTNDLIEVARSCARESMRRHIAEIGAGMSVFERFKLGFKLPAAYSPLDALDLRHRHYAPGDYATRLFLREAVKVNAPTYRGGSDHLMREFTSNTLERARSRDNEYRFVKGFTQRTVTQRVIDSLYHELPDWEGCNVVFLPKSANFDTADFPGVDWEDVPVLKPKRKPPTLSTPHIYVAMRDCESFDAESFDTEIIILDTNTSAGNAKYMSKQFPGMTFVWPPEGTTRKAEKARAALKEHDHVLYSKWIKDMVKEMAKGLSIHDKRWACTPTNLIRLYNEFGPYMGDITNAAFRKLLPKPPTNRELIARIEAIHGPVHTALSDAQARKLIDEAEAKYEAIERDYPLVVRNQRVHGTDASGLVPYINALGRQRKDIIPDPDFVPEKAEYRYF
jgi:hypothetical protein